jgi:uncharacterized repeat protein (TIGR04076 family)
MSNIIHEICYNKKQLEMSQEVAMFRVKVTVVETARREDHIKKYCKNGEMPACPFFKEGDTFYVDYMDEMPEGFCAWMWHDIHKDIMCLLTGGEFFWMDDPESALVCCTDPFRTVYLLLEREVVPNPNRGY